MLNYSRENRRNLLNVADTADAAVEMRRNANAINLELDTPIYRILSYPRFLEMLRTHQNTLVRPSMWDDPFENVLLNHEYRKPNGDLIDMSCISNSWYGQCWTHRSEECDGLWRVYTNNGAQRSVRIKTTIRKIFEPLYDGSRDKEWQFFIGRVDYSTEEEIRGILELASQPLAGDHTNVNQMQMLLTKRKEFSYEQEVRILYCKGVDHDNHDIISQYNIMPDVVFEEVLLDPWCQDHMVKNYADEIYLAGYHGVVSKSKLYAPLNLTTQLV